MNKLPVFLLCILLTGCSGNEMLIQRKIHCYEDSEAINSLVALLNQWSHVKPF